MPPQRTGHRWTARRRSRTRSRSPARGREGSADGGRRRAGRRGEAGRHRASLDEALQKFLSDEELWLQRGRLSRRISRSGARGASGFGPLLREGADPRPGHFASHHFLAHAYENSGRVPDALTQGATYAKMAPAVPHARHMDGHNLRRAGRIDEAIAEFTEADALETAYFAAEKIPVEYDWHYQHNLDLLATSYQYVGRMRKAEELFRRSFAIPSSLLVQEFNKREWPVFLLARGRAPEALAAAGTMAAHRSPVVSAAGHVEAGRVHLAGERRHGDGEE